MGVRVKIVLPLLFENLFVNLFPGKKAHKKQLIMNNEQLILRLTNY